MVLRADAAYQAQWATLSLTLVMDIESVRRALDQVVQAFDPLRVWVANWHAPERPRVPPLGERQKRYAAIERRRRNEMLRQMAAYQRRQAGRADVSSR